MINAPQTPRGGDKFSFPPLPKLRLLFSAVKNGVFLITARLSAALQFISRLTTWCAVLCNRRMRRVQPVAAARTRLCLSDSAFLFSFSLSLNCVCAGRECDLLFFLSACCKWNARRRALLRDQETALSDCFVDAQRRGRTPLCSSDEGHSN
jgi:hypothetical protein